MKNKQKPLHIRLYKSAEVTVDPPSADQAKPEALINMRFRTLEISDRGQTETVTPWVTFTPDLAESLANSLSGLVATARRWKPGEKPEIVGGESLGIYQSEPFKDI